MKCGEEEEPCVCRYGPCCQLRSSPAATEPFLGQWHGRSSVTGTTQDSCCCVSLNLPADIHTLESSQTRTPGHWFPNLSLLLIPCQTWVNTPVSLSSGLGRGARKLLSKRFSREAHSLQPFSKTLLGARWVWNKIFVSNTFLWNRLQSVHYFSSPALTITVLTRHSPTDFQTWKQADHCACLKEENKEESSHSETFCLLR